MDPKIRMHEQLEGLFSNATSSSLNSKMMKQKMIAEGEAPEDENEIAKASEAHFEIMDLFKEGSDFKGCKYLSLIM